MRQRRNDDNSRRRYDDHDSNCYDFDHILSCRVDLGRNCYDFDHDSRSRFDHLLVFD